MALAVLMALLAPLHAEASPSARVEHDLAGRSDSSTASAEIVAAIVEGSIRGSMAITGDSLDVEAVYTPATGSAAASPPRRSVARSGRSSPAASNTRGARSASAGTVEVQTTSARAIETREANSREVRDAAGSSFVGFWLLIVASAAGALLLLGAGRRVRSPARRR